MQSQLRVRSHASHAFRTRLSRRVMHVTAKALLMEDKRVLITGGNTGIGFEAAKVLSAQGAEVVIACRDPARASAAVEKIKQQQPGAAISSVSLDLASLASVRDCASRLADEGKHFDVLLNNAGVMACPKMQTKDGFEYQLGINHLGHFALTNQLLPSLLESKKPVRIVNVASMAHFTGSMKFDDLFRDKPGAYNEWEAYGQSKLANVMFTYELARRMQQHPQVTVNCLHPGVVRTELGRYMVNDSNKWIMAPLVAVAFLFFKSPEQGAETSIHLSSAPEVSNITGKYYVDCKPSMSSPASYDQAVQKKLWEVSSELTNVDLTVGKVAVTASA